MRTNEKLRKMIKANLIAETRQNAERSITKGNLNEISNELAAKAASARDERGQTDSGGNIRMMQFNKNLGRELEGKDFELYYKEYRIQRIRPSENEVLVVVDAGNDEKYQLTYDALGDVWSVKGMGEVIVNRKSARMLGLIAKSVNPETKYNKGVGDLKVRDM